MSRKILTAIIVILTLLFSIFIQINLLNTIPMLGVIANIGIIIIAGLGLFCGKLVGGLSGAFYGLMLDIVFNKIIGINILLYTLTGIYTGKVSSRFSKDSKVGLIMVVGFSTFFFEIIHYMLLSMIHGNDLKMFQAIIIVVIESVYNLILTLILHKFIMNLGEIINKAKNSYYLL